MFLNLKNRVSEDLDDKIFDSYNNPATLLHQRQFNLSYNKRSSKIDSGLKRQVKQQAETVSTNAEALTTARNDSYCDQSTGKELFSQRSMSVLLRKQASNKILDLQYSNNFKGRDRVNFLEKISRVRRLEQFDSSLNTRNMKKNGGSPSSQYEDTLLFPPTTHRSQNTSQLINIKSTSLLEESTSQELSKILNDSTASPRKQQDLPQIKNSQGHVHKYLSSLASQRIGRSVDQQEALEAFQSIPSSKHYQNKKPNQIQSHISRNTPSLILSGRDQRPRSLLRGESNLSLISTFIQQGANPDRQQSHLELNNSTQQRIQYVSIMDESDQANISVYEQPQPLIAPLSLGQRKIIAETRHNYYSNQFTRNHEQKYQERSMPIKKKKDDLWSAERKSTFPIKKLDIVKKIKLTEANEIRQQIDQVIDNKPQANFTYDQSLFRYMDRTVNFEGRLNQIDQILNKGCFDGTWDLVKPSYKYVKDPLLEKGVKKKKHFNINDDLIKERIGHIKYTHDHQGMIVTMNGSKYENWQHMKEIHDRRDEEKLQRKAFTSFKQEFPIDERQSEGYSTQFQNSLSPGSLKRIKSKQSDLTPSYEPKRQFIKQKNNAIMDNLTLYFTDKLRRLFAQETCMRLLKKFQRELQRQLDAPDGIMDEIRKRATDGDDQVEDSDPEDDELARMISKLPDEEFEKRLVSSQYDGDFKKLVTQARETEMDQRIVGSITGNPEVNVKTALRKDSSLVPKLRSVQDKLKFVYQISQAHEALDKVLKPKAIKRWKLDAIGETRLTKVLQSIKDEFSKIHDQISRKREQIFEPENQSVSLDQALLIFHEQCAKYNVVPPMLKKKIEESMRLEIANIKMNEGLCLALGEVANKFFPDHIETLVLEDNSLEDDYFSSLLKNIYQAKRIKGQYIINNSIGSKSLRVLQSMLEKQYPFHLDELVLTGSQLCQGGLSQLLWSCKVELQIRVLGLSQLEFDEKSLNELISLVQKSQSLEILDLSFCHFHVPKALPTFLKQVASKNTLQYLNLSFNPHQDSPSFADSLKMFIQSSSTLTHLNLSACNLTDSKDVLKIFEGVKKSKTLQSIHFSGNHFDSEGPIGDKVRQMLGVWKIQRGLNSEQGLFTKNDKEEERREKKEATKGTKNQAKRVVNVKTHKNQEVNYHREEEFIVAGDSVVFSRVLGRLEILNGYKWVQRDQCWICAGWQYVVLIWSKVVGDHLYETIQQAKFMDKLKTKPQIDQERIEPIVFPFTYQGKDSQPQYMLSMGDFMERLEQNFKPHSRLVIKKEEQKRLQDLSNLVILRSKQKLDFNNTLKMAVLENNNQNHLLSQMRLQQQDEWRTIYKENKQWPLTFERLLFAPDRLLCRPISTEEVQAIKPKPDELFFAHADYYPPTKQKPVSFAVYFPQLDPKHVFIKTFHINTRDKIRQHLTTTKKRSKRTRIDRNFNLKQSVFGHWAININAEYRKMFEADMQYSKIKRFVKEGTESYNEICNNMILNYGKIYEVYIYCSGLSHYPSIQWIDFTDMCSSNWKIIDKNLTLATVDRLFIAVNFEGVPGGLDDNPDKELCRYEFFEIMVRMAIAKFPTLSQHEALRKMLDEYVLADPETLSWWQYRQELMWTLEVDDLMKANQANLRKLYQSVQTTIKKTFTSEDAVDMVQDCPGLKLTEKETTLAFAFSKFIVIDEMAEIDNLHLLNFGEFNEFVARLSQVRYGDPKMPMQDKIYKTMLELFKLIGVTPQLPQTNNIGDSESDYDDFKEQDERNTKMVY